MTLAVQTIPWPEVAAFFEQLSGRHGRAFESMKELVQFIASSRYAHGMFAAIMGETLCIGRTPNFTASKEELRIGFDEDKQAFTFTHIKNPDEKYPWSLSCSASEWNSAFERIVHKRLRWFHEG